MPTDKDIMGMLSEDRGNALWQQSQQEFPVLKNLDIGFKYAPGRENAQGTMESWPAQETGSPDFPRPPEFDINKFGVEVYDPKARPIDIMGDVASHLMIETDPRIKNYYAQFQAGLSPQQQQFLRNKYAYAQANEAEKRAYEEWLQMSGLPGYFRGYAFQQWPEKFNKEVYTPEQMKMFDEMMAYLRGAMPEKGK